MVAMILMIVLGLHFYFYFDAFVIGGLIGLGGLCHGWIAGA